MIGSNYDTDSQIRAACQGDSACEKQARQQSAMVGAGGLAIGACIMGGCEVAIAVAAVKGLSWVASRLTSSAYRIAVNDGRHSGFLKTALNQTNRQLGRTMRSLERRAQQHRDYIRDPAKATSEKGGDWSNMSKFQRKNTIEFWKKEAENYSDQAKIAADILRNR